MFSSTAIKDIFQRAFGADAEPTALLRAVYLIGHIAEQRLLVGVPEDVQSSIVIRHGFDSQSAAEPNGLPRVRSAVDESLPF